MGGMRRSTLLFVVVLASATLAPRTANACHTGEQIGRAMFTLLSFGIDIPLTIHDIVVRDSSKPYAVAEVLVAGGLAAGSIALAFPRTCEEGGSDYPTSSASERRLSIGLAVWNIALVAHGVYELVKPRKRTTAPMMVPVALSTTDGDTLGLGVMTRF
jgi:hypothetical protein